MSTTDRRTQQKKVHELTDQAILKALTKALGILDENGLARLGDIVDVLLDDLPEDEVTDFEDLPWGLLSENDRNFSKPILEAIFEPFVAYQEMPVERQQTLIAKLRNAIYGGKT